jgi:hypothetical protein
MVFSGVGIVKHKGKVVARFIDGKFETNDPAVQERLKTLGFVEVKPQTAVEPPKEAAKPAKKGTRK